MKAGYIIHNRTRYTTESLQTLADTLWCIHHGKGKKELQHSLVVQFDYYSPTTTKRDRHRQWNEEGLYVKDSRYPKDKTDRLEYVSILKPSPEMYRGMSDLEALSYAGGLIPHAVWKQVLERFYQFSPNMGHGAVRRAREALSASGFSLEVQDKERPKKELVLSDQIAAAQRDCISQFRSARRFLRSQKHWERKLEEANREIAKAKKGKVKAAKATLVASRNVNRNEAQKKEMRDGLQ